MNGEQKISIQLSNNARVSAGMAGGRKRYKSIRGPRYRH